MSLIRGGVSGDDKETLRYFKYNPTSDQLEATRAVQTTLNSFFLGEQHKMSSGAENIFFTNLTSDIDWYPAWGGIKDQSNPANSGAEGLVHPSFRVPSINNFQVEPEGPMATSGATTYGSSTTTAINQSVYGTEFMLEQDVLDTDRLVYRVYLGADNTGTEIYSQVRSGLSQSPGDLITWTFDHALEGRAATTIYVSVELFNDKDQNQGEILVRATANDPSKHYAKITLRSFTDENVNLGQKFITASQDIYIDMDYMVDTTAGAVNLPVNRGAGMKAFRIYDASQNFNMNSCIVDFGAPQGQAVLQTKNDSFLFYWDDTQWRYIDLNTKGGGVV